jgi:hypothetical protein
MSTKPPEKINSSIEAMKLLDDKQLDENLNTYLYTAIKNTNTKVLEYIVYREKITWLEILDIFTLNENKEGISYIIDNGKSTLYDLGDSIVTWDSYLYRVISNWNFNLVEWIIKERKSTNYKYAFPALWFYVPERREQWEKIMGLLKTCMNNAEYTEDEYVDAICYAAHSSLMTTEIVELILKDIKYRDKVILGTIHYFRFEDDNNEERLRIMEMLKREMKKYEYDERAYIKAFAYALTDTDVTCIISESILKDTKYTDKIITLTLQDIKDPILFKCLFLKLNLENIDKFELLKSTVIYSTVENTKFIATFPEFLSVITDVFSDLVYRHYIDKAEMLMDINVKIQGDVTIENVAKKGNVDFVEKMLQHENVFISDRDALFQITTGENPEIKMNHITAFRLACKYKNTNFLKDKISNIPTELIGQELDKVTTRSIVDLPGDVPMGSVLESSADPYVNILVDELTKRSLTDVVAGYAKDPLTVVLDQLKYENAERERKKIEEKALIEKNKEAKIESNKKRAMIQTITKFITLPFKR